LGVALVAMDGVLDVADALLDAALRLPDHAPGARAPVPDLLPQPHLESAADPVDRARPWSSFGRHRGSDRGMAREIGRSRIAPARTRAGMIPAATTHRGFLAM
jgi:hypothetical protein